MRTNPYGLQLDNVTKSHYATDIGGSIPQQPTTYIKYTDMKIILLSLLLTVIAIGGGYAIGEWLAKDIIKFLKDNLKS